MKQLLTFICTLMCLNLFSQTWPMKQLVEDKKLAKGEFLNIPAFTFSGNKQLNTRGSYQELTLVNSFSQQLLSQKPEAIKITIPLERNKTIECELVRYELGNIKFTQNNQDEIPNVKIPVTYRGVIAREAVKNNVILTVNEDYLSLVATKGSQVLQITKADEKSDYTYRLYNNSKIKFPATNFSCGTSDQTPSPLVNALQQQNNSITPTASIDKCVSVFVDCTDSMYRWRDSSSQQTLYYVYELFNAVAAGYFNEQIKIVVNGINVWTTPAPYVTIDRDTALTTLATYYKSDYWGNMCICLDYGAVKAGKANGIGEIKGVAPNSCPNDKAICYNDLNYNSVAETKNFPVGPSTTGAQIYLLIHEIGHLLGSRHTKWCGWKLSSNPDVYGALDSCGDRELRQGQTVLCAQGPPLPPTGATIMSYCVNGDSTQFVNYNNGFGPLPGAVIRNFVDQSTCIPICEECVAINNNRLFYQRLKSIKQPPPLLAHRNTALPFLFPPNANLTITPKN